MVHCRNCEEPINWFDGSWRHADSGFRPCFPVAYPTGTVARPGLDAPLADMLREATRFIYEASDGTGGTVQLAGDLEDLYRSFGA